jgi:hypothetical protein
MASNLLPIERKLIFAIKEGKKNYLTHEACYPLTLRRLCPLMSYRSTYVEAYNSFDLIYESHMRLCLLLAIARKSSGEAVKFTSVCPQSLIRQFSCCRRTLCMSCTLCISLSQHGNESMPKI